MTIKPLTRYEPASHEVDSGAPSNRRVGPATEHYMQEEPLGAYINRFDMESAIRTMLANACDPAENDTLYNVLKLLGKEA